MVDFYNIQVNYRKKIAELFKEVAFYILVESRNLGLRIIINCARQTKFDFLYGRRTGLILTANQYRFNYIRGTILTPLKDHICADTQQADS